MPTAISTARSYSLACREHACVNGLGRRRECKLSCVLDLLSHTSALHFWADFSDLARAFHVATKVCARQDFCHSCFRTRRKRVVLNGNSGYASYKEKVTTFKVPCDPVKMEMWAHAIPKKDRELTSSGYVCEKHFSESHIKRLQYYGELGGKVVLNKTKRPVLLPDAVPSIFQHCPSCLRFARKDGPLHLTWTVGSVRRWKLRWFKTQLCSLFAMWRKVIWCVLSRSFPTSPMLLNEEASNDICAAEGQETGTCTDSCGAANAHTPTKSSKLSRSQVCLFEKLIGPQEIVMPSASWSWQDIVEGAPSICFVQLKKATPTTLVFVNKSLDLTGC